MYQFVKYLRHFSSLFASFPQNRSSYRKRATYWPVIPRDSREFVRLFNGSERTLLAVITKVGLALRIFHIFSRSVFIRVTEVEMFNLVTVHQKYKLEFLTSVLIPSSEC